MLLWGLLIAGLPLGRGKDDVDRFVPPLRNMESFIVAMQRLDSDGLPCDTLGRSNCLGNPLALSLLHLSTDPAGLPHLELGGDTEEHLSKVEERISELRWKNLPLGKLSKRQGHLLNLLLSFGPFLPTVPSDRIAFAEAFLARNVPGMPAHLQAVPSRRIYFLLEAALQQQSEGTLAAHKSILAATLLHDQQQDTPPAASAASVCPNGRPPEWIAQIAAKAPSEPPLIREAITSRLCSAHSPPLQQILQQDPSTEPERALQPFLDAYPEVAFSDRQLAMVYRQAKTLDRAAHLQLLAELPIILPTSSLHRELYARYATYVKNLWDGPQGISVTMAICTGLSIVDDSIIARMLVSTASNFDLESCRLLSWGMSLVMPGAIRRSLIIRILRERVDPAWRGPDELLYRPPLTDHSDVALFSLGVGEPIEALLKSPPEADKILRLKLLFRLGDSIADAITEPWESILGALSLQLTGQKRVPLPDDPEAAKQLIRLMLTRCDLRRPEEFARAIRAIRMGDPDDSLRQCLDRFFITRLNNPPDTYDEHSARKKLSQVALHTLLHESTGIAITTPTQLAPLQERTDPSSFLAHLTMLADDLPLAFQKENSAPDIYREWLEYLCPLRHFKVPTVVPDLRLIWHRLAQTHWTCPALEELLGQINSGPSLIDPRRQSLIEQLVSKHAAADATRLAGYSLSYLQAITREPVDSPMLSVLLAQPATRLFLAMPLYGPILQRILDEDSDTRRAYLALQPLDISPASADILLPFLDAAFHNTMSPPDALPELASFKPIPAPSASTKSSAPPRTAWQTISNIFFYGIPLTMFLAQPDRYESLFSVALSHRQPPLLPPITREELIRRTIEEGLGKSWADFEREYGSLGS